MILSAGFVVVRAGTALVLTSPQSRAILGTLDILVDIGVLAEKEVIQ
jgi:hypothetical protein